MTRDELIERAKRQLNAGQPEPRTWPESEIDLAACVLQASAELADRVMRDPYLRALLQQEYEVTLDGSGEGDLLTATGSVTGAAGEILLEGVCYGVVLDADGNRLQWLAHYADFLSPQSTVFAYYTLKDKTTILTRALGAQVNAPADIQPVNGPLTITANYAPASASNFPPELEDMLVHALCGVVTRKTSPANADA